MPLSRGFVAILDVLGFKGIWQDCDPDKVINLMRRVESESRRFFESVNKMASSYGTSMEFHSAYLSDTIVLAVTLDKDLSENLINDAFDLIGFASAMCAEAWALSEPARTLRGCVSYGEFMIDHPYIIGPAVDEAALYHECADGAFIWCTDSVLNAYAAKQPDAKNLGGRREWWTYDVPLKKGTISTFALDYSYSRAIPFGDEELCCIPLRERILGSFGIDQNLESKRRNTERFINECESRNKVALCLGVDWDEHLNSLRT
jgi:hypothetical protein